MTVYGIVGTIGSGKTILMTALGILDYMKGNVIYANYDLKNIDYKKINKIDDLKNLKDDKPKTILMDELWLSADSRDHMDEVTRFCAKNFLQSRKVKSDIFYTSQSLSQVDVRIRNITSCVYLPSISYWGPDGKPVLAKVGVSTQDVYGDLILKRSFYMPLVCEGGYICDMYDTSEIVDQLDDGNDKIINDLLEKYADYTGTKQKLKSVLILKEGLKTGLAGQIANYIKEEGETE